MVQTGIYNTGSTLNREIRVYGKVIQSNVTFAKAFRYAEDNDLTVADAWIIADELKEQVEVREV